MRYLLILLAVLVGCAQQRPAAERPEPNGQAVDAQAPPADGPVQIQTPEIVQLLEEADLRAIETNHDQLIHIRLKDGRQFVGRYNHEQAGKYTADPQLLDIFNLASHTYRVREQRGERDRLWTEVAAE